jgi:hypothetical protein
MSAGDGADAGGGTQGDGAGGAAPAGGAPGDATAGTEGAAAAAAAAAGATVAPEHWSAADKELFKTLTPAAQARWVEREKEQQTGLDKKFQEVAAVRREGEQLQEIFAPFEREMGLKGLTRVDSIRQLVAAHRYLIDKPVEAIQWLANNYGIDLKQVIYGDGGEGSQDPHVKNLTGQFMKMNEKLDGFINERMRDEHSRNLARVDAFAKEAKDGKLLRPHFDELMPDILRLMRAGEKDLQKAYDDACRINPAVRQKIEAAEAVAKKEAEEAARKKAIEDARRAGSGSHVDGGGGDKRPTNQPLEQELATALAGWPE